jgi:hypothetical protein
MTNTTHTTVMFYASAVLLALSCSIIAVDGDLLLGGTTMLVGVFTLLLAVMPGQGEDA